jgi:hypothetical protein
MRFMIVLILALLAVLIGIPAGFLPGSDTTVLSCGGNLAGFFYGLAHGFLLLWTFLAGFLYDVGMYEPCNNGAWYNGGYVLGVMLYFGASLFRGKE